MDSEQASARLSSSADLTSSKKSGRTEASGHPSTR
jgi:hypothetical protein